MGSSPSLDITKSSMFTGAGTPWGAMKSADPGDMPGMPKDRNINEFAAYDTSEMVKRLINNLSGAGAAQTQGALRQASRMGAGQSDAARRQVNNIAADVEDRGRGIELQAAKDSWDSQMQQKQFAENMDMARYTQAMDAWKLKKAMRDEEDASRKSGLSNAMSLNSNAAVGGAWNSIQRGGK